MAKERAVESSLVQADLPEPWLPLTEADGQGFVTELNREVSRGHVLFGKDNVQAIARREDCDDVLFAVDSLFALVHLAYSGREQDPRWPATVLFGSWNEFVSAASNEVPGSSQ